MPDDEREWSLEGVVKRSRKASEDEVKAKQCKQCYAVYHAAKSVCPACGVASEGKPRVVEHEEGELVRVEIQRKQQRAEVGRARTLQELERIERERGYKRGWAQMVYRARQARV